MERRKRKLLRAELDTICGSCHSVRLFWDKYDKFGWVVAFDYLKTRPGWSDKRGREFATALEAAERA